MKKFTVVLVATITVFGFSSCRVQKGCPSNGANIGAERILSGDPKAMKAIKRGKKFRS